MIRRVIGATVVLALGLTSIPLGAQSEEASRVRDATTVLKEVMAAEDQAIPAKLLQEAVAIAVFPSLVEAAFIFGGQRGHGILSVRNEKSGTWSQPAFMTITGGSVGLQIGGQAIDLVLLIQNRRGLDQLIDNQFKIGADASAAAGPVGRDASAATDIQLRAQILSYSRTRGLFAGVSVNGSTLRQDRDANERFYGKPYSTREIVIERLGGAPDPVAAWRETLAKYAGGS
jgi:lipid-binding SYLF domain-containing protein